MLSENPYLSAGIFPKRTYCAGVAYDIGPNGATTHSTLDVWYSDNPGTQSFQLLGGVPIDQGEYPLFLDKPSIATSWHGGTLGWTYVAAVVVHLDQNNGNGYHDIQLYRQTGPAAGFYLVNAQFSDILITSPIVIVNPNDGNVYLLWVDPRYQVIQIARSRNYGNTFSPAATLWPGHLLNNESINGAVRASSVIMARFNPLNNSIGVVWHQRETDGAHTDVFFDRFDVATQTWGAVHHVGHPSLGNDQRDQWNPALDPSATTGAYLVTWYDRRDDPNDITYKVWATKINPDGTALDTQDTLLYSNGLAADTNVLPLIPPPPSPGDCAIWESIRTSLSGTAPGSRARYI